MGVARHPRASTFTFVDKFGAWIQISRLHSVFAKLLLGQEVCKFWSISRETA